MAPPDAPPPGLAFATLAGGCFWCLEAVFEELEGVMEVISGYTGGHTERPDYAEVCTGESGHAEVVRLTYDPSRVGYRELLEVFFAIHDPTTLNRQGNDVGTQYRSAIFFHTAEQREIAAALLCEISASNVCGAPAVTELVPAGPFHAAEGYHRGYFRAHADQPYCQMVVRPKLEKFRCRFAARRKNP